MEPRFNKPLNNKEIATTSGIPCPSKNRIYEKEPKYDETSGPKIVIILFQYLGPLSEFHVVCTSFVKCLFRFQHHVVSALIT